MRHGLEHHLFDREKSRQRSRTLSIFTLGKNPHLTKKNKLHSKSTYFYRWGSGLNHVVPSVCGLALLVGGITTINPILNNIEKVSAGAIKGDGSDSSSSTTSTIALNITSNENIGTDGSTTVKPGEIAYRSYIFNVSGTAPQYALTLSAANGYTGELKGKDHPDAVIGKVAPSTIPDNFANNTWGYAMTTRNSQTTASSSLTYNPVPTSNSEAPALLTYRSGLTGEYTDIYKLAFAAKLGPDNPSDHYQTQVYLSAVSDSKEIAELGFFDKSGNRIANMQDMTSTFCGNVNVGTEGRLQDTRDGKYYYVGKMADNKCWMVQNLDYDGGGTKIEDLVDWNENDTNSNGIIVGNATAAYYDAGEYVYNGSNNNHAQTTACANNAVGLSDCLGNNQFAKVVPSSDLHYHVGNYYSWVAATNGDTTTNEPKQGICPNGWQLPTSNTTSTGSFAGLLMPYKMATDTSNGTIESTEAISINGTAAKKYQIYNDPLYFVYGGLINGGWLSSAGDYGFYWSSTPNGSGRAYVLRFYSDVHPAGNNYRYSGSFVRCVAQ